MLRITTQTEATRTVLELEGKLAGAWVQELERCWRKAGNSDRPIRVLLRAVAFIDDKGKDLLVEMYEHGTELVAEGCMTKAVVEEIKQRRRQNDE